MAYSYALLVCPHSPCWPTYRTGSSSAVILHAGLLLLRLARLTSFLLTYIWTFGRNTLLGIGRLHLVQVASLSSFAVLAHSYAFLVCPHSPCWPTSRTGCSSALILHAVLLLGRIARLTSILLTYVRTCGFDLVFADLHSDVWQKRRVRHRWPTSGTCCSFVLIRCAGLLVRVARLSTFSLLANISYRLLVGPHSPRWPPVHTRRSSALILHAGLLLLRVARFSSFLLTYIQTLGRNTLLGVGGLHLVRVARLSSFVALAYSYSLLVCPHSLCWPTSRTSCSSALILHAGLLLLRIARLTSFLLTYI